MPFVDSFPYLWIESNVKIFSILFFVKMKVSFGRGQSEAIFDIEEDVWETGLVSTILYRIQLNVITFVSLACKIEECKSFFSSNMSHILNLESDFL